MVGITSQVHGDSPLLVKMDRQQDLDPGHEKGDNEVIKSIPFNQTEISRNSNLGQDGRGTRSASWYLTREERTKLFSKPREQDVLFTLDGLIKEARLYWYKPRREKKHVPSSLVKNAAAGNNCAVFFDPLTHRVNFRSTAQKV